MTMTQNWAATQRSDKYCSSRSEEQRIITLIQDLLDRSINPESAAHSIATIYEPRLQEGEKISHHLFSLVSHAIIHPTTTLENHQQIVEMLLHLSKLSDVISNGVLLKENGRTYWHSIPEFSFWFSQHALHIHTIESIDLGNCPLSWHQQAYQYKQANTFAAIYTSALSPSITHEWRSMQSTALHSLSQALEGEMQSYPQVRRAGIHIPAASAWMHHAAPTIWQFCKSKLFYDRAVEQRYWFGGSDGGRGLWDGDEGFGVERWGFWKQRFEEVGSLKRRGFAGRVVDDVVKCARQAVMVMQRVEQEDAFGLDGIVGLFERDEMSSLEL